MKYPYGNSIFITGASSGIGLAAAEAFAQAGYQVFAAARSCEDGARGNVTGIRMDVTDEASVVRAKEIVAAQGGVGIILNCAGRGIVGAAEDALDENVRYLFEVNYFGVLRVNRLFMPMLRERGCGLVLIVSSVAGQMPVPYHVHYCGTKYALDCYAEALRMEARQFGVRVSLIQPGGTKTNISQSRLIAIPRESPYAQDCATAELHFSNQEQTGNAPENVARAMLKLAQKRKPPVRVTIGALYKSALLLRRLSPARAFEFVLQRMFD